MTVKSVRLMCQKLEGWLLSGFGTRIRDRSPEVDIRASGYVSTQPLHAYEHQHEDCDRACRHYGGDVSDRLDVLGEQDEAERHRDEQACKDDASRH